MDNNNVVPNITALSARLIGIVSERLAKQVINTKEVEDGLLNAKHIGDSSTEAEEVKLYDYEGDASEDSL